MVWEDYPTSNVLSQVLETDWCGATQGSVPATSAQDTMSSAHDHQDGSLTRNSALALSTRDSMPSRLPPPELPSKMPPIHSGSPSLTGLRSGRFLPLAEDAGFLACPQSLSTFEGIGHCVGIQPLGVTVGSGMHPPLDLYVQCSAQVWTRLRERHT